MSATQIAVLNYLEGNSILSVSKFMGWSRNYTEKVLHQAGVVRHPSGKQHPKIVGIRSAGNRRDIQCRFDEKFIPEPNTGCWLWTGSMDGHGYGQIRDKRKNRAAHRVSMELAGVTIDDGKIVRHKCDTPACVNPDHLIVGTMAENTADMVSRGRHDWSGLERGWNRKRCAYVRA